jgi:MGT family glycosyltransferase
MAKIVVLNLPEHGHMNTTYPVVTELVRRGNEVTYYATEPYRANVEAAGAGFASYGDSESMRPPAHAGGLHSVMAWEMSLAEKLLPQLVKEVSAAKPDYLLTDSMCVWGNLLQQILKVPGICMASVFVPNDRHVTVEAMVQAGYGAARKELLLAGIDALNSYIEISRRIDQRFGTLSPNIVEFFSNRQGLNVVFTSREFHPGGESYDATYKFVGPILDPRETGSQLEELGLNGEGPLIYVSLGTIFNDMPDFYRASFEAYGGEDIRVLIATGNKVDRGALGPVPENITLREHVPQLEVLQQAALFVTHGGMNSTSEALANGVPLLVFPQHGDQHLVAERVVQLGAGLRLTPQDISSDRLRMLTRKVLHEPVFAAAAQRIAESFTQGGGARAAADEITDFVSGRTKVNDEAPCQTFA